ncbi:hypothetical protein MVES_001859 [Malassezia vespertilionis]|uniref:Acyl-CoA desaturase n=2 Tax=Malassezia vespertilionis TaxID=2020962 RepID=A0A2N1JBW5_9BASI|nr:hypothetical protein MVES_001859 [Malassezia vespertilionis]
MALALPPLIALYGFATYPVQRATLLWSITYYFLTGLGITAGYHRLWSHRAYSASDPLQAFLMCMGSGAVEGSIHWWARGHRSHHRYTDTDLDPYGAHTGLIWAHLGWMIVKPRRKPGRVDTSDLKMNKFIKFQHRFYVPMILFWGLVFPTIVAGFGWGDWKGGFYFAGIARLVFVHHSTFCINSLAHYLGEASFDNKHSPRDNFITALVTIGEGYHNFHHEFPMDFRNAIFWYQYDPTKWFIWSMFKLGLASNLKVFPENEVNKGRLAMQLKNALEFKETLDYSKPASELPILTWDEFEAEAKKRPLIVVHGFIHDVADFMDEHPGGRALISSRLGRDATTAFEGGIYEHSNAAHNLLSMMRIGVLSGGYEPAKIRPSHIRTRSRTDSGFASRSTSQGSASDSDCVDESTHDEVSHKDGEIARAASQYVPPGEAYDILQHRELGENVKMESTSYGKLF